MEFYVKKLFDEDTIFASRRAFAINSIHKQENNKDNDITVVIDDIAYNDCNYAGRYTMFIFAGKNADKNIVDMALVNARDLDKIWFNPKQIRNEEKRYYFVQLGNKKDFSKAKEKGNVDAELDINEVLNNDYMYSVYKRFQDYLPDVPEM